MRVVTENYMLYPNLIPKRVPIKMITDYNINLTETCVKNHIIVNLLIFFNENVLDNNIEYVACKIYRSNNTVTSLIIESRVNFISGVPFSSIINTDTTTTMDEVKTTLNIARITTATTTGSGCKMSLHLITLS